MTDRPFWSAQKPIRLGLVTSALLVFGFGGWAVFATISGAVVASGQVEVESNRQVVQHLDGGLVKSLHVKEGDEVVAGQVLISLDGQSLQSEHAIVAGQLAEVIARKARLIAERDDLEALSLGELHDGSASTDDQLRLFEARRATYLGQIDQLEKRQAQIAEQETGLKEQLAALEKQIGLVATDLKREQTLLDKGHVDVSRKSAFQKDEARLVGEVGQVRAALAASRERISEVSLEILNLQSLRREAATDELRQIGPVEIELQERQLHLDNKIANLDIRAPSSGIVFGLSVTTIGAVIKPADPLLFIVPQDRPMIVALQLPPNGVDNVFPGQSVRLVFPAFASKVTADVFGEVLFVSADAIQDPRSQASYFRVDVAIPPEALTVLGEEKLVPGMPVEGFLKTHDRSPATIFLEPFARYFDKAFREG
jgi:HlyD family secretion protein